MSFIYLIFIKCLVCARHQGAMGRSAGKLTPNKGVRKPQGAARVPCAGGPPRALTPQSLCLPLAVVTVSSVTFFIHTYTYKYVPIYTVYTCDTHTYTQALNSLLPKSCMNIHSLMQGQMLKSLQRARHYSRQQEQSRRHLCLTEAPLLWGRGRT